MTSEPTKAKKKGITRRNILGTSAAAAVAGAVGTVGLGHLRHEGVTSAKAQTAPTPAGSHAQATVAPGELDEYYVFSSSGQSGEIRILGLPSMRELMPSNPDNSPVTAPLTEVFHIGRR